MDEQVSNSLKHLRTYRDRYLEVADSFFGTDKRLFISDLLYIAAINRSFSLHRGFCDLIESENFNSAAPLIRLQLDNCLRLVALDFVPDRGKFVVDVFSGKQINKMKSATGEKLTDRYLCEQVAKQHSWIHTIYEEASDFVHLSDKHISASIKPDSTNADKIKFYISDRDPFISPKDFLDAIFVFAQVTELFFAIVKSWGELRASRDANSS